MPRKENDTDPCNMQGEEKSCQTEYPPPWETLLGFDFGVKNIGVAVGQRVTRTANALKPLRAKDGIPNWQVVEQLIIEWQPDAFIVGIPFNMDGSLSEMAQRARKFGNRLKGRFVKPWHPVDERLSSNEAKEWAYRLNHKGNFSSRPVDSIAAQILLESWMNQN